MKTGYFKAILLVLLTLALSITLFGCGGGGGSSQGSTPPPEEKKDAEDNGEEGEDAPSQGEEQKTPEATTPAPPAAPVEPTLGSMVKFDRLEITFDSEYTTTTTAAGDTVIVVGVVVKNAATDQKSLRMEYVSLYKGGLELPDLRDEFPDDDVAFGGNLAPGESYEASFHLLYDGNADYFIKMAISWGDNVEVKVPVNL
ncbi:MAG: hypothetical protein FWF91_00105 [Coriobacteriia bacterium]|nr:hypothetical protein [Coriobacteriia bacterium]